MAVIIRGHYLSLTFCCDFGHVWLLSRPVESSVSAFMCQLLSLLDSLVLRFLVPLFSSVYRLLMWLTEHFEVSLKPLVTFTAVLRSVVYVFSLCLRCVPSASVQPLLCCLCGLVPECVMQLLVFAVLSVPHALYFRGEHHRQQGLLIQAGVSQWAAYIWATVCEIGQ